MPFEPQTLFPGQLADSVAKLAQDVANHHPQQPPASIINDMGWNAVLVPEGLGGIGGRFDDLASILEGLASNAVSLPVITRCGIVPSILNALPDNPQARALLQGIADASRVIELGGPLRAQDPTPPLSAQPSSSGWRVSGTTTPIALTEDCTHALLVCRDTASHQWMLACVEVQALRRGAVEFGTMDDRKMASCRLESLEVAADHVLSTGPQAEQALQAGLQLGVTAVATDTVAAMGSMLARTISYLLERRQFGQPLAQFQALRHDVARLYVVYETARSLLQSSLGALETARQDSQRASDMTAFELLGLYVSQEAIPFAECVIQLHGGMGMTREMPAAQLATRLMANAFLFSDPLAYRHNLHAMRSRTPS